MATQTSISDLEAATAELNSAVKTFAADTVDMNLKSNVYACARKILALTQNPEEQWLWQSVNMSEYAAIRTFMRWEAFDKIPKEGSISYKELGEKCNATEELITRIAWMMVCCGTLKQIGEDHVAHTPNSLYYTNNNPTPSLFRVMMDVVWVPYGYYGEYFDKYGRKEPWGMTHNPMTFGFKQPERSYWEIIHEDPVSLRNFMQSMNTMEHHLPIGGMYDFTTVLEKHKEDPKRTLLIDVGGGMAQAIRKLTKDWPIPLENCILQDRPEVVKELETQALPELKGCVLMSHNFFEPQPVKGAAIYWIRRCLHDYSDEDCIKIIQHLSDACAPDSKVLIVEQVLTNPPGPLVAYTDMVMLNIGGKERTRKNFEKIATAAGMKVTNVFMSKTTPVGCIELSKV